MNDLATPTKTISLCLSEHKIHYLLRPKMLKIKMLGGSCRTKNFLIHVLNERRYANTCTHKAGYARKQIFGEEKWNKFRCFTLFNNCKTWQNSCSTKMKNGNEKWKIESPFHEFSYVQWMLNSIYSTSPE